METPKNEVKDVIDTVEEQPEPVDDVPSSSDDTISGETETTEEIDETTEEPEKKPEVIEPNPVEGETLRELALRKETERLRGLLRKEKTAELFVKHESPNLEVVDPLLDEYDPEELS